MKQIVIFLYLVSLSSNLLADTFLLANGETVEGTLVEQTEKFVIFRDDKGETRAVAREDIKSIQLNENGRTTVENAAKEGENSGTISSGYKGTAKPDGDKKDVPPVQIDVTHEIVTDFVWRGNSYGGEYLARRNNTSYKEFSEYYAYQPNLKIASPTGLYFELWGNLPLVGRTDRDSDQRLLQNGPGGSAIDPNRLASRIANGNLYDPADGTSIFLDPSNNIYQSSCADPDAALASSLATPGARTDCQVDPRRIGAKKERNGMYRTDGLFTTFAYNFGESKFGTFTMGTWWYFQNDKNSRYSWQEYFLWWDLPFLKKIIAPRIQVFTQSSQDLGAAADGGNYAAFQMSKTFMEDKPFQIQLMNSTGYKYVNNNTDKRSGLFDITSTIKFIYKQMFLTLNDAYRPDLHLYDNSTFYFQNSSGSNALANRSQYDGQTVDPSKLYGWKNLLVYDAINGSSEPELVKQYLTERYQNQNIPRHLYWISIGYNQTF
ncbi:MAG: hypothetical protein SFU98_22695 [Leptospiraceae bacterium]|nr:hypothetical protein [Leptospiraceae bacterium]